MYCLNPIRHKYLRRVEGELRASFRTLRHGLEIEQILLLRHCLVFPMRFGQLESRKSVRGSYKLMYDRPDGITSDPFHRYIVLSFVNGPLVLQISEDIEEVQETGFLSQEPTLAVQQIGEDVLLQVHPRGIRHILADKWMNERKVPQGRTIVRATTNKPSSCCGV